jgi:hypothetical protein
MIDLRREAGVALLTTIMALLLMSAFGAALVLTAAAETAIASQFRNQIGARYAADAIVARAIDEVSAIGDWSLVVDGAVRSAWIDGPSSGPRTLSDGSTIDLAQIVNLANCQKATACSAADLSAVSADRPWGANNPRWRPFAYGPLRDLQGAGIDSPYYVIALAANGPLPPLLALRAEAYGPRGTHAVVELMAGYNNVPGQGAVKILSWREVR